MSRRPRGSGCVPTRPRKNGLYAAAWFDTTGKRHWLYDRDPKALERRLAEAIRKNRQGIRPDADKLTVGEWLREWLEDYATRVEESTWRRAEELFRLHVVPRVGRLKIGDHLVREMTQVKQDMLEGLAPRTVRQAMRYLHIAFADAEGAQLRPSGSNPMDHVRPPRIGPTDPMPLTDEAVHRVLAAAHRSQPRWYPLFMFLAVTGLDVGMGLALRRGQLDLVTRSWAATKTIRRTKEHGLVSRSPKTSRRVREGLIPEELVPILLDHLAVIDAERAQAALDGRPWAPEWEDLVFPLEGVGGPKDPGVLTNHHWQLVLQAAGMAPRSVKLKDFRPTVSSILEEEGIGKATQQKMLGHAPGSRVTDDHYTAVRDRSLRKASDTLALRLLRGGLDSPQTSAPDGA